MEQKYCISNVNISVFSDFCIHADEKWSRFRSEHTRPTLTYRIHSSDALPQTRGSLEYEDRRVRTYLDGGIVLREYLDSFGCPYCLAKETSVEHWDLYVRKKNLPWGSKVSHYFELFDLTHAFLNQGILLLHSAYILTDRGAILFTAPSGTGKSTQAGLWEKHRGARIINGDRAAIRMENGIATAFGLPFSGSSSCCENVSAPILAVVGLSQAPENRIQRLQGVSAVRELLRGVYLLPEHRGNMPKIFDLALAIGEQIPIYHLACLPDENAVKTLEEALNLL